MVTAMVLSPPPVLCVLQHMADAVPAHPRGDESCDIASSCEIVALLVHAILVSLHFEFRGFDEREQVTPDTADPASSPNLLPEWNARSDSFSFVYAHPESSMRFVIRVGRLGNMAEIRGLTLGSERIYRIDRSLRDVVRSAALPIRISLTSQGGEDRSDLAQKLRAALVSEQIVTELQSEIMTEFVQSFIPGIDTSPKNNARAQGENISGSQRDNINQVNEPRAQGVTLPRLMGRDPVSNKLYGTPDLLPGQLQTRSSSPVGDFPPPGFEDEHKINRPRHGGPSLIWSDGRSPFSIGGEDLNPPGLGPSDPFRGSLVGGGLPHPGGFSGMHPTFDDPLFDPLGGGGSGGGGGGFDPQVPPGARWDPIGPGGVLGGVRRNYPSGPGGRGFGGGDII